MSRILVIKLGALGDVVQAFGPFAAIRAHHPTAHITLLTTPPFRTLAERSPWFDAVDPGGRPDWHNLADLWGLSRRLRRGAFDRVYDLQTSPRSTRYRWFVGRGAAWSGVAATPLRHANPRRNALHTVDRQREQLAIAGIAAVPAPALDWLDGDTAGFGLPPRFALLIPGASAHRPGKRWPHFPALAQALGMPAVVVVGAAAEAPLAAAIAGAIDLTGRTDLLALGAIARRAAVAIGNDTGPTHLAAATGCPTVALFGAESDPARCAPRGAAVRVLRAAPIGRLDPREVAAAAVVLAR